MLDTRIIINILYSIIIIIIIIGLFSKLLCIQTVNKIKISLLLKETIKADVNSVYHNSATIELTIRVLMWHKGGAIKVVMYIMHVVFKTSKTSTQTLASYIDSK